MSRRATVIRVSASGKAWKLAEKKTTFSLVSTFYSVTDLNFLVALAPDATVSQALSQLSNVYCKSQKCGLNGIKVRNDDSNSV